MSFPGVCTGGYFICNGNEKIVRLLVLAKRNYVIALKRSANAKRGPSYSNLAVAIRCVERDLTSITVRLHYLNDGRANIAFSLRKREYFIPAALLLKVCLPPRPFPGNAVALRIIVYRDGPRWWACALQE